MFRLNQRILPMRAAPAGTPVSSRTPWLGFLVMCGGMFMAILDIQVVATSLPTIQHALGIATDQMIWIQTAYLTAEIVAIPLLLERLELTGALVTIDAMGTQTEIADKIVARGGDYLLALKGNRPLLHKEVVAFFDDPPAEMLQPAHETPDGDHGRIEERRHVVCHEVDWLFSDRRYKDEPRFLLISTRN